MNQPSAPTSPDNVAPVELGSVPSMRIVVVFVVSRLPARSRAPYASAWTPSVVSATGVVYGIAAAPSTETVNPATPLWASFGVSATDTGPVNQPFVPAVPVATAAVEGFVTSTFTVRVRVVSTLPARSTDAYRTLCVPDVVRAIVLAMTLYVPPSIKAFLAVTPLPVSTALSFTVVADVYQPSPPTVPAVTDVELTGAVPSIVTLPFATAGALPQSSVAVSRQVYVPLGTCAPSSPIRSQVQRRQSPRMSV